MGSQGARRPHLCAAQLDALLASGSSAEQIAALVKVALADEEARAAERRRAARERQRKHREKVRGLVSRTVTRDTPTPPSSPSSLPPPPNPTPPISPSSPTRAADSADVRWAAGLFEEMARQLGLPLPAPLTPARTNRLRSILETYGSSAWCDAIARLKKSGFCQGANRRGWKANLDFLLTPEKFLRLLEGRYDDNHGIGRQPLSERSARTASDYLLALANEIGDRNAR